MQDQQHKKIRMNRFKDKTFIGFYFKFPFYYYSILNITAQQFDFVSHQKQQYLPRDLSKKVCVYAAIPLAEVDFFTQKVKPHKHVQDNCHILSTFYLGHQHDHKVFLTAQVATPFFQEHLIRFGKQLTQPCYFEVDVLALWHLAYWLGLKHDYFNLIILWIYKLEQGFYLLLGKGENLWTYTFTPSLEKIANWLAHLDWPYPEFYCGLNIEIESHIPKRKVLLVSQLNQWTLSAALALRGAYAAI